MESKPAKQGVVERSCGKTLHQYYFVLWPRRTDTEARLDVHDSESAFLEKLQNGYPLQESVYFFIDEFSGMLIKPTESRQYSIELISKVTEKPYLSFQVSSRAEAFSWADRISEIIEEYAVEQEHRTHACLDHKVKPEKSAIKFPVTVGDSSLARNLDISFQQGSVFVQKNSFLLKLKSDRTICWNLNALRRYKKRPDTFIMEAGRRSDAGAGILYLVCNKSEQLLNAVSKNLHNIARSASARRPTKREENEYTSCEDAIPAPIPCSAPTYEELEGYRPLPKIPTEEKLYTRLSAGY